LVAVSGVQAAKVTAAALMISSFVYIFSPIDHPTTPIRQGGGWQKGAYPVRFCAEKWAVVEMV